jgi:hypothetical protein
MGSNANEDFHLIKNPALLLNEGLLGFNVAPSKEMLYSD